MMDSKEKGREDEFWNTCLHKISNVQFAVAGFPH